MENYEIINYKDENINLDLKLSIKEGTIWFTVNDLASLFSKDRTAITRQIAKITKENTKFNIGRSRAKFAQHLPDGRVFEVICYNLDVVEQLSIKFGSNQYEKLKNLLTTRERELNQDFNKIIIYNNGNVALDVRISPYEKTVWLSEKQIADLFGTTRQNINLHVQNIIKDNELDPISVSKDYLHTAPDGKCYVIKLFNLDMILAVGYRVRSAIAINFRKWASDVLSAYLLKGVVIDDQRCLACQNEILKLRNDINEIKLNQRQEIMYFKGESLRGFIEIKRFLETAKKEIIIIDNYFSKDFDEVLKNINVRKIVITNNNNEKVQESSFYELYKCNDFHGRYIFVDDVCYHSDPSFKDIGNHDDLVTKLNEPSYVEHIKNVVQTITNRR